jgi:phospholipase C
MDPKKDTYVNYSSTGTEIRAAPTNELYSADPPHETSYVIASLASGKPDGFVLQFEKYQKEKNVPVAEENLKDIMGYTVKGFLPAMHKMAEFACVCTQWYSCLRGSTWPNRMFALSGSSFDWLKTPDMNLHLLKEFKPLLKQWYDFKPPQPQKFSIFEVLAERKVPFHIFGDSALDFTLAGDVFYPTVGVSEFSVFKKQAKDGKLPSFSFLEPNYINMPRFGYVQNDDHPPSNTLKAQYFIAEVYETLRTSPKWKNSLLVIAYDEHGGFFDPMMPPEAHIPDAVSTDPERTFGYYGVRVPAVLVSPCVKHGLDDTLLSHASLLKYVLQKWAPEGVIQLGERVKYANSLPVMQVPRDDQFPPITDADFKPLQDFRAAHNIPNSPPPGSPSNKLPAHESAAQAIKDPEIEHNLRTLIVNKRLGKLAKGTAQATSTGSAQRHPYELVGTQPEKREGVLEHALHEIQTAGEKIIHGVEHLLAGKDADYPVAYAPAPVPVPAPAHFVPVPVPSHPAQVSSAAVVAAALANRTAQEDAERYADDIISKIKQGTDVTTGPNTSLTCDILANQIRATSLCVEKQVGTNDLARAHLKLMHVRAKKHAKKLLAKKQEIK